MRRVDVIVSPSRLCLLSATFLFIHSHEAPLFLQVEILFGDTTSLCITRCHRIPSDLQFLQDTRPRHVTGIAGSPGMNELHQIRLPKGPVKIFRGFRTIFRPPALVLEPRVRFSKIEFTVGDTRDAAALSVSIGQAIYQPIVHTSLKLFRVVWSL